MALAFNEAKNDQGEVNSLTVTIRTKDSSDVFIVDKDSVSWESVNEIYDRLKNETISLKEAEEALINSFQTNIYTAEEKLRELSDNVSTDGEYIYYKGERIEGAIENYLVAALRSGESYAPIVNFIERINLNQSRRIREQLFKWLLSYSNESNKFPFTITSDGMIVGYKGCQIIDGIPHSINRGTAFIKKLDEDDFIEYNGEIPYPMGSIARMDRRDVQDDPNQGCSYGLHVGTWNYASGWAKGIVLTVEIDPVNVVSVPSDCAYQKLRCCEFKVIGVTEQRLDTLVLSTHNDDDERTNDEEEERFCEECDRELSVFEDNTCDECNERYCEECDAVLSLCENGICDDCADSE